MRIKDLVQSLLFVTVQGNEHQEITGLASDSRDVKPGYLFIALRGYQTDGHRYIQQAIQQGAVAIMVEEPINLTEAVTVIQVPDTRRALALLGSRFYDYPSRNLRVIGVTGTNGKTTTSHLIQQIFLHDEKEIGLIGTTGMEIKGQEYPVANTTPDRLELQKGFRTMLDKGCQYAVMEVSSHALDMGRLWGTQFSVGVFTNLTQDHLDYHQSMEQYKEAKALLFQQLGCQYKENRSENAVAIFNADDPATSYFIHTTPAQVVTYGLTEKAQVRATDIQFTEKGTQFQLESPWGSCRIDLQLVGTFNVYNALAAITVAFIEGISLSSIQRYLRSVQGVDGRMELVQAGQSFSVIVDYAHTPDSLDNVLQTVHEFAKGKVITVFGCGGDRDRSKRPIMGRIATSKSDLTIITSDNPRSEDPEQIMADVVEGIEERQANKFVSIMDRKEAIEFAVEQAQSGDIVLIAGKGHETYQEINGVRNDFDDREVARQAIMGVVK